jgi:RHS repeat-associated protein
LTNPTLINTTAHTRPNNLEGINYAIQQNELSPEFHCYDYGARFYDPSLGRFHTIDGFAEKFAYQSPCLYAGNNPIKFIDINGDSLTVNAQEWADNIKTSANNQISSNNNQIANLNTKLSNGDISQRKYDRKMNRLNTANTGLNATISEINTLASSNQWYDVQLSTGMTNAKGTAAAGITSYDFGSNMVVMSVDMKNYDLGAMAHEFKHAYQFETGDMSLIPGGRTSNFLWDIYNEREANFRSSFFGAKTITEESGKTEHLYIRNLNEANYWISKFKKNKIKIAFRYHGKTFVSK